MKGVWDLVDGDVAVVGADLDVHHGLEHLLSADELIRAGRLRQRIHRRRSVAARGLLRLLLAERLGQEPRTVRIVTTSHGKPWLGEGHSLHFNIAHSDGDAVFAFTAIGDIGVDIERVRPLDPVLLSRTCFSARERDQLLGLEPSRRLEAFFDGWVRKEAVIKADGRGLSLGLDSFTVTLRGPARLVEAPQGGDPGPWSLTSLEAGPCLRAALAVRGRQTPR